MTTPVEKRNHAKFCEFHGEVGHTMDECMHLKKQIEEMLKAGKLSHLIKEIKQNSGKEQPKEAKKGEPSGKDKALAILMMVDRPQKYYTSIALPGFTQKSRTNWSPYPYNGIIGRPGVRKLQAVPSTAHKMLKLPIEGGVITLKSSRISRANSNDWFHSHIRGLQQVVRPTPTKLGYFFLEAYGHDWPPKAYCRASLKRAEGMLSGPTKEKGGKQPIETRQYKKK
ncbi:hypothetical protein Tco_0803304 [Tanacetum coccineum]|uniref:Reverse transcriptase domain-containing protein n=1 Tax=Tanacetum coccineum TaxID=301880 RepID=A0ABQ5A3Z0_9ASTR